MDGFNEAVTSPDSIAQLPIAEMVAADKVERRSQCADCNAHETGECDYHFESFGRHHDDDETISAADEQFAAILEWGK